MGPGKGQILKRALLSFPAAPTCFQIIPAVSLVAIIYFGALIIISRNVGSGEVAWAYPPASLWPPADFAPALFIFCDTEMPVFTGPLYHWAAVVRGAPSHVKAPSRALTPGWAQSKPETKAFFLRTSLLPF